VAWQRHHPRCPQPAELSAMVRSCSRLDGRQLKPKLTPCPGHRHHTECTVHPFDGFANDSETNTGALVRQLWMNALKHIEQLVLIFGGYADAVVVHKKSDKPAIQFGPDLDGWRYSGRHELHRVAQKIRNNLGQ